MKELSVAILAKLLSSRKRLFPSFHKSIEIGHTPQIYAYFLNTAVYKIH